MIELLQQKIAFLENFIDLIPGNIYWKDFSGNYIGCNTNVANILKLSDRDKIVGKNDFNLMDKALAQMVCETDQQIMQQGKEKILDELGINSKGEKIIYISKKAPVYQGNKIIGIFGTSIGYIPSVHCEISKLSKREMECLLHLSKGKTAKEIARLLNLSPRTIESHLLHLKDKLNCDNKSQLIEKYEYFKTYY